jgi:hypothetical protein
MGRRNYLFHRILLKCFNKPWLKVGSYMKTLKAAKDTMCGMKREINTMRERIRILKEHVVTFLKILTQK